MRQQVKSKTFSKIPKMYTWFAYKGYNNFKAFCVCGTKLEWTKISPTVESTWTKLKRVAFLYYTC